MACFSKEGAETGRSWLGDSRQKENGVWISRKVCRYAEWKGAKGHRVTAHQPAQAPGTIQVAHVLCKQEQIFFFSLLVCAGQRTSSDVVPWEPFTLVL